MHHAEGAELVVTEGVMGYYDGISLDSDQASTYDVARTLGLPVILVVPARGMASTILAVLKGMIEYRNDSNIRGIILNRISPMLYPKMKKRSKRDCRQWDSRFRWLVMCRRRMLFIWRVGIWD